MAAMTTALTTFSILGDSRTYTTSAHTVTQPRVVLQKRKVPTGNKVVAEDLVSVVYGTKDAANNVLVPKIVFSASVSFPIQGATADRDSALALFREIVASDNFTTLVSQSKPLS